jgi:hypothetical protein
VIAAVRRLLTHGSLTLALLLPGGSASAARSQSDASDPETLAFRLDAHRVVILLAYDAHTRPDASLPSQEPSARLLGSIQLLPADRTLPDPYAIDARRGDRWTVRSSGRDYAMSLDQFALADGQDCGDGSTALAVLSTSDAAFTRDRAKYFVAFRAGTPPPPPRRNPSMPLSLTVAQRDQLVVAVTAESKQRIPELIGPGARVDVQDVQAFRLSPDGQPRLFVRSRIVESRSSQPGLVLWLKQDRNAFVVESTDDWLAKFIAERSSESRGASREPADYRVVLNVVPARDGWAYVVFGQRGYESILITVYRYSERGFVAAGLAFSHGC